MKIILKITYRIFFFRRNLRRAGGKGEYGPLKHSLDYSDPNFELVIFFFCLFTERNISKKRCDI